MKQAGITVSGVGLRGRFHCQCHHDSLDAIIDFCNSNPAFQFPTVSDLALPMHLNPEGKGIKEGKLHDIILRMILVEQSRWYETFAYVQAYTATFGLGSCQRLPSGHDIPNLGRVTR